MCYLFLLYCHFFPLLDLAISLPRSTTTFPSEITKATRCFLDKSSVSWKKMTKLCRLNDVLIFQFKKAKIFWPIQCLFIVTYLKYYLFAIWYLYFVLLNVLLLQPAVPFIREGGKSKYVVEICSSAHWCITYYWAATWRPSIAIPQFKTFNTVVETVPWKGGGDEHDVLL